MRSSQVLSAVRQQHDQLAQAASFLDQVVAFYFPLPLPRPAIVIHHGYAPEQRLPAQKLLSSCGEAVDHWRVQRQLGS